MATRTPRRVLALFAGTMMATAFLPMQHASAQETYQRPPEQVARIVEAPPAPGVSMDPQRRWMMLLHRTALPPVADMAAPMLRLAGRRINPDTNGPHGPRRTIGMSLRTLEGPTEVRLATPAGAGLAGPVWNADGSRFAFTATFDDRIELWVGETQSAAKTGQVRRLIDARLNSASGGAVRWMPDNTTLLVRLVPANRGAKPVEPAAPLGPVVQTAVAGQRAQVRTFQDMLRNSFDEDMFDWVMGTQLALVDSASGSMRTLGQPANWNMLDPSPDGRFLLASRIVRPYSYVVPASLFGEVTEVLDAQSGSVVVELKRTGVRDQIPIEGVETGPRGHEWVDTMPATLAWAEALDEGNPNNKVPQRDKLMLLEAPFTANAREFKRTEHRFTGMGMVQPGPHGQHWAMVSEYDRDRKWSRTWLMDMASPDAAPRLMRDLSINDRYNDPGSPLSTLLPNGRGVVRVDEGKMWLSGAGATPQGDRPTLKTQALADLSIADVWRCAEGVYESVVDVLADGRVVTSFESPTDFPNFFVRSAGQLGDARPTTALTTFTDPVPEVQQVGKQLVTYKRADGVDLSATIYTPPGYDPARDGPLPLLVWAYPLEFTDASTAGQVSAAPTTFTRMGGSSHLALVFAGYAVMDDATVPVVGDPKTANDTFVEQIVAGAQAAIDKAVEMGIANRDRVAIAGHSYGAFMTANLLAHSDLFRAGVARSGAYNRTLTPFGFQGERRTFWEAQDTYNEMSPFNHADKINEPLLLIHGQIDNNPGTFPVQSERLFGAMRGLGGTARLVMLPFESHGYMAMESCLHVQAETIAWLDKYVKNATPREPKAASAQPR